MILQLPYSPADSWSRWSADWLPFSAQQVILDSLYNRTSFQEDKWCLQGQYPHGELEVVTQVSSQFGPKETGIRPRFSLEGVEQHCENCNTSWVNCEHMRINGLSVWRASPFRETQGTEWLRSHTALKVFPLEKASPKGASMWLHLPTVSCCLPWRAESQELEEEESWLSIFGQGLLEETKDGDSAPQ